MITMVVDGNNLCSRMFFVMPGMSAPGTNEQRGAIHGFLTQVRKLREQFNATRLAFCFDADADTYRRKDLFGGYKVLNPNGGMGTKDKKFLRPQIKRLREEILPALGFRNVFRQDGYEADDLVAACCNSYQVKEAVIVSSDKDLFQCLSTHPGKVVTQYVFDTNVRTEGWLMATWGVTPKEWPKVKALSGDISDNIPGVPGVKEKTAVRYMMGEISTTSQVYRSIKLHKERYELNLKLVTLPFEGCEIPELREDADTPASWDRVTRRLDLQLR